MNKAGDCQLKLKRKSFKLDIEFVIPAAGIMGLFGESGCGKTSVLRALAGLDFHQGSRFTLNGVELQNKQLFIPAENRQVGLVFQDLNLFPHLTVLKNFQYAQKRNQRTDKIQLVEVLKVLDIESLLQRMPVDLSGGEKQRVAVARTLITQPELLLLDEPMSALDYSNKMRLIPYLREVHQAFNIPMIVVSHDLDVVTQLCDQLLTINQGVCQSHESVHQAMLSNDSGQFNNHQLVSVFDTHVVAHEIEFGLSHVKTPSGTELMINGIMDVKQTIRLTINAHDVALSLSAPNDSSILNVLAGTVIDIKAGQAFDRLVTVRVGDDLLMCLVSKKSAVTLELNVAQKVYLQIKTNAIILSGY